MNYDVAIVGGGPAGLQAALTLGRADKKVLVFDSGPRRNAAATHIHNFVTRDGTPPDEFRAAARRELEGYPVAFRDARVDAIEGVAGEFRLRVGHETVQAARVLLCTGMIDQPLGIPGFREQWGARIYQCPYCHGWEVRGRPWAYLASSANHLEFAGLLRGWTDDVHLLFHGLDPSTVDFESRLKGTGVNVVTAAVEQLSAGRDNMVDARLSDGRTVTAVLFAHPSQRQVPVVAALGLDQDEGGYVRVDPMTQQTSRPGIYAAGDLLRSAQSVAFAVGGAAHAAGMLNYDLTLSALRNSA